MSYKVEYETLHLNDDGEIGNVYQGSGTVYTDAPIEKIPSILNDHLKPQKKVGEILNIIGVKGKCIG